MCISGARRGANQDANGGVESIAFIWYDMVEVVLVEMRMMVLKVCNMN